MTEDEIREEVRDLRERVDDLEHEQEALARVPEAVAELKGMVKTLRDVVIKVGDGAARIEKASSMRTALQFAAVVIVPILVALLGGYFVIRAGVPSGR